MNIIFLRSAAAAWSPAQLFAASEIGVWYDPSDLSTMWTDTGRTTPVTTDGDLVACIDDKSGNGFHATQSNSSLRPAYKTSGGLHWLAFDGTDDCLATSSIDFTATDAMSMFLGVKRNNANTTVIVELSANAGGNAGTFYLVGGLDTGIIWNSEGYTAMANGDIITLAAQIYVSAPETSVITATHDISGDLSTIRRNAVDGTSNTANKGAGNFGNYPLFIGARNQASLHLNGNIYGYIARGAASSAGDVDSAEAWMAGKAGVTL